ncbi:hypothetical protein Scep_005223 [Stephania cephalantha]|uniref:Uncharacterized protein n=1 Tax=Stephania cephalantha TaxID=152367 RepID=A0AAP0PXZ9_9MAGN
MSGETPPPSPQAHLSRPWRPNLHSHRNNNNRPQQRSTKFNNKPQNTTALTLRAMEKKDNH